MAEEAADRTAAVAADFMAAAVAAVSMEAPGALMGAALRIAAVDSAEDRAAVVGRSAAAAALELRVLVADRSDGRAAAARHGPALSGTAGVRQAHLAEAVRA